MERLLSEHPSFSPFALLKISMTCHGARLSRRALERLQEPDYRFGTPEAASPGGAASNSFDIEFEGRPAGLVMPGAVLLRDSTFVYVNWGETYEDPFLVDYDPELGAFLLRESLEGDPAIDVVDFVSRPAIFGRQTSRGTLMDRSLT